MASLALSLCLSTSFSSTILGCAGVLPPRFQTPDGSTVVVCANPFSEHVEVVMDVASERFSLRLDARSFNTIVLGS